MTKGNLSWGHLVFDWMRRGHLMGGEVVFCFWLDEKRPSVLGHLVLCWMRKAHLLGRIIFLVG
jgi:hypothetical protein